MKIAEINPITPNYLVSKNLTKKEGKEIENKNVSLPNQSYRDFNINFRGRTPEDFYEQEYNIKNMPSTMKKYLHQDYETRKHIPPEQVMSEVFKFIPLASNVEEVKELYPQEELFANLHEASTKGRTGILSDIKIAYDIEQAPLIKDSDENFGVYLLRKIYTEGKTIREINKDFFEKDLNDVYKGVITQPITYSTTSAYGIKYPKTDFWHSFIATRDEYKRFFVENMPKVDKTPNTAKETTKKTAEKEVKKETPKKRIYTIQKYRKDALTNEIKQAKGEKAAIEKAIRRRFSKDDPEASFIVKYLSPIMTIAADKVHLSEEEKAFAELDKNNTQGGYMFTRFWKANPALLEHYSTAITDTIELFEERYGGGGNVPIDKDFRIVKDPSQKTLDYVSEDFLELLDYSQTIAPKRNARYLEHERLQEEWNKHFLERYGEVKEQENPALEETKKTAAPTISGIKHSSIEDKGTIITMLNKTGKPLNYQINLDKVLDRFLRKHKLAQFPTDYQDFYVRAAQKNPIVSTIVKKSIAMRNYRDLFLEGQLLTDDEIIETLDELDTDFIKKHYNEAQAAIFATCEVQSQESNPINTYANEFSVVENTQKAESNNILKETEKQALLNKLYKEYKSPISKSEASKASFMLVDFIQNYDAKNSGITLYGSQENAIFTNTFINTLKNSMNFDMAIRNIVGRSSKSILRDIFAKMIMKHNGIKSILKKNDGPELKHAKIESSTYTVLKYFWEHCGEINKTLTEGERILMTQVVDNFQEAIKLFR